MRRRKIRRGRMTTNASKARVTRGPDAEAERGGAVLAALSSRPVRRPARQEVKNTRASL